MSHYEIESEKDIYQPRITQRFPIIYLPFYLLADTHFPYSIDPTRHVQETPLIFLANSNKNLTLSVLPPPVLNDEKFYVWGCAESLLVTTLLFPQKYGQRQDRIINFSNQLYAVHASCWDYPLDHHRVSLVRAKICLR